LGRRQREFRIGVWRTAKRVQVKVQQGFSLTPEAASPPFLAALGWLANANEE
jgi:hypothetical protein